MNKASEVMNDIFMILTESHTMRSADNLIHPLVWCYSSGRMTHDQEYALKHLNTKQKHIVAKKLERGGTIEESARRVMSYLNKFKVAA